MKSSLASVMFLFAALCSVHASNIEQFLASWRDKNESTYKVTYLVSVSQYPNFQEEVFAGNQRVLDELGKTDALVVRREEIVALIVVGDRFAVHRTKIAEDGSIALNIKITKSSTETKYQYLKPKVALSEVGKSRVLIENVKPNALSGDGLGKLLSPEMLLREQIDMLNSLQTTNTHESVSKETEHVTFTSASPDSTVESDWLVAAGVPTRIVRDFNSTNGRRLRETTKFMYDSSTFDPSLVPVPKHASVVKQIFLNGKFNSYLVVEIRVLGLEIMQKATAIAELEKLTLLDIDYSLLKEKPDQETSGNQ